ncbi:MAG: VOC family protein, partial [Candidatus Eremiobacteraeota bacterium]|nr:VOC family protein [Candidatus Eremiobacteraeota bacterium]
VDHIIYTDPDLRNGIATFAATYGVKAMPGGRHLGFGTRNALIGLGEESYLEIVALDPEQDVPASKRFLRLEEHSMPGFATWCARANRPLEETVAIAREAGLDLGEISWMSRKRQDGSTISWRWTSRWTSPFAAREAVLPFYVDWGDAAHPASTLPPLLTLVSLTCLHPDIERIRDLLRALGEDCVETQYGPEPSLRVRLR